ncbi:MAG: type IV pilus assembly protein PilM [Myxococcota bacterium]|jgi:type IV pilus assembly protein PilM
MAQRIVGLDIGTWSIKAMVLESSLRRAAFVDFREHHIPRDPAGHAIEGEQLAAIIATLRDFKGDGVATAMPGDKFLVREVTFPFNDVKQIDKVLGFELETLLPKPLNEVVYDHYHLNREGDETQLLVPAVDRTAVAERVAMLKEADADPRYLTMAELAVGNIVPHLGIETAGRTVAMIDLGHRTTSVSVVADGRVDAVRTVSRGGHHLTIALMRGLGVDYGMAEQVKHTGVRFDGYLPEGLDETEHANRARLVARALEALLREVRMTLQALEERTGRRVDEVVVYGGTARVPGIGSLVGRVLDLPVRPLEVTGELWDGLPADVEPGVSAVVAGALALEHVADATQTVNFRQGELAYESDFRVIRERARWFAVLAAILLVIFVGRKIYQRSVLEDQQAQLVSSLEAFSGDLLGEDAPKINAENPLASFKTLERVLTNPPSTVGVSLYPSMTAFKVFYDVTNIQAGFNEDAQLVDGDLEPSEEDADAAPEKVRAQVELTSVATEATEATIRGVGYDVSTIERFRSSLERHVCFPEVKQQGGTPDVRYGNRKDWKEFTLKVTVKCPSNAAEPELAESATDGKPTGDK